MNPDLYSPDALPFLAVMMLASYALGRLHQARRDRRRRQIRAMEMAGIIYARREALIHRAN